MLDSPSQLTPAPLLDACTGLPGPVEMPGSDNPGTVVATWGQRAPLTRCELLPCLHAEDGLCVPPHGPFLCWGHSGMWQLLAERTEIFLCVWVSEGDDLRYKVESGLRLEPGHRTDPAPRDGN